MSRPTRPIPFRYHPELDGLRALAMIVIVFFHAGVAGASNTFIALDLFFVLSGFLVTHVVMSEIEESGTLRLGRFYARRVRRLLPAAVVAIVATSVVVVLTVSQTERLQFIRHAEAALVYLANWQFVSEAYDYFASDMTASPFMHYWSLSLEEQYYILFPLVILLVVKFARHRIRALLITLGALFVASLAAQVIWAQIDPMRAYYGTDARLFQLLAGALLALGLRELARRRTTDGELNLPLVGTVIASVGLLGYVVLGSELIPMANSNRNILATGLAGAMVVGLYLAPTSRLTAVFARPTPVYLGKISYGTYLYHWPLVLLLGQFMTVRPSVVAVLALVLASALAALSYQVLETPIRKTKVLDRFEVRTVAAGLTVSLVAALLVVGPVLGSARTPSIVLADDAGDRAGEVSERQEVTRALERAAPKIDATEVEKQRGPSRSCTPDDPDECVLVDGDGKHVVLVGDSHARMLGDGLRALAEERGYKLSVNVAADCPFHDDLYVSGGRGADRDRCRDVSGPFFEKTLPKMDADVVIMASYPRTGSKWDGKLERGDGSSGDADRLVAAATERSVKRVNRAGADAILVKGVFGTDGWGKDGFDPAACLDKASRLKECAVTQPSDRPKEDAIYDALAIKERRAAAVDLTPMICPTAPVCVPMEGDQVVWRNNFHLSSAFVEKERKRFGKILDETGLLT